MEQIGARASGVAMIISAHTLGLGAIDIFGNGRTKAKVHAQSM